MNDPNERIFTCPKCGVNNRPFGANKPFSCHYCGTSYDIVNNAVIQIPSTPNSNPANKQPISNDTIEDSSTSKSFIPYIFYTIIGLIVTFYLIQELTTTSNPTPSASIPLQDSISESTYPKLNCDFTSAEMKAIEKTKRLGLHYVDQRLGPEYIQEIYCRVTYYFYVKKIENDLNGVSTTGDKIYNLNISYERIGDEFEFMEANLYDIQNGTVTRLN
ncbi:MAG TPA: hypothetical protein VGD22_05615 [Sphingobacteriaceae bacterium]